MINGKLVRLRAIEPADYPRLTEFKNDVEYELLGGGIPPRPRRESEVAEFFDNLAKEKGHYTFAIEADGTMIGDCGLHSIDQRSGVAELGIGIGDRAYWGRGYGREAVALLVDYGFRMQNLRKIWLNVYRSNERAVRSYRAAGFTEEGCQRAHAWSDGGFEDVLFMAIFRPEAAPDQPAPRG